MISIQHNIRDCSGSYTLPELTQVNAETGRYYIAPNGMHYPSMSTVTGLLSKEAIEAWKASVGAEEAEKKSRHAATRGTKVHALAEHYMLRNEDKLLTEWKGAMPDARFNFSGLSVHIDRSISEVRACELRMWSDELRIAGTVDCIAVHEGVLRVIDFKTSAKLKKRDWIHNYFIQASGYARMWKERFGEEINEIGIIIATDAQKEPQLFVEPVEPWLKELKKLRLEFYKQKGY